MLNTSLVTSQKKTTMSRTQSLPYQSIVMTTHNILTQMPTLITTTTPTSTANIFIASITTTTSQPTQQIQRQL